MRARIVLAAGIAAAVAAGIGIAAALGEFSSGSGPAAAPAPGVSVLAHATIAVVDANGKAVATPRVPIDLLSLGAHHAGQTVWGILSGRNVAGDWDVTLAGTACPPSNRDFCQLFEADATTTAFDATADAKDLEVRMATAAGGAFRLVLAGTLPVARAGTIVRLATGLQACPPRSPAGRDCAVSYDAISDRFLSTPVRVKAGQRLSIRIVFGFGA